MQKTVKNGVPFWGVLYHLLCSLLLHTNDYLFQKYFRGYDMHNKFLLFYSTIDM